MGLGMGREGHRTRCGWLFIDFVISHFSLDSASGCSRNLSNSSTRDLTFLRVILFLSY